MGWVSDFWTSRPNSDWTSSAIQKIAETSDQIRCEWLLSDSALAQARSRRDITGEFIVSFLDEAAAEITALSATELARRIKQRDLTAMETILAFCHRAAVAHQIVSTDGTQHSRRLDHETYSRDRTIVSTRFFLKRRFGELMSWIAIKRKLEPFLGPSTEFQSV